MTTLVRRNSTVRFFTSDLGPDLLDETADALIDVESNGIVSGTVETYDGVTRLSDEDRT